MSASGMYLGCCRGGKSNGRHLPGAQFAWHPHHGAPPEVLPLGAVYLPVVTSHREPSQSHVHPSQFTEEVLKAELQLKEDCLRWTKAGEVLESRAAWSRPLCVVKCSLIQRRPLKLSSCPPPKRCGGHFGNSITHQVSRMQWSAEGGESVMCSCQQWQPSHID